MIPRFGEFCCCCCLPLLPGFACSIHATWGPPYSRALYSGNCNLHWERGRGIASQFGMKYDPYFGAYPAISHRKVLFGIGEEGSVTCCLRPKTLRIARNIRSLLSQHDLHNPRCRIFNNFLSRFGERELLFYQNVPHVHTKRVWE